MVHRQGHVVRKLVEIMRGENTVLVGAEGYLNIENPAARK